MAQNNKLKTFIRVDASGRDIPSSNVLRKKMPVTGKWRETTAYECCNPVLTTLLTSTPADVTLTTVVFTLSCDAVEVATLSATATTTDIDTLVDALNTNFSMYGVFSVNGTDVDLALNKAIGTSLCPDGVLSFVIS